MVFFPFLFRLSDGEGEGGGGGKEERGKWGGREERYMVWLD